MHGLDAKFAITKRENSMTTVIKGSVGQHGKNMLDDVRVVQHLLNISSAPTKPLPENGICNPATIDAISAFQKKNSLIMDGRVDPSGITIVSLLKRAKDAQHATSKMSPSNGGALIAYSIFNVVQYLYRYTAATFESDHSGSSNPGGLPESEYIAAARTLDCEVAAIKAVVETEVGVRGAFDSQQRPTILFERHIFSSRTGGKFDKTNPDLSNPIAGGYGRFIEQYPKLERAINLNRRAALESVSWGAFQIMGFNHKQAGFNSIDEFVEAMKKSVQKQIAAFITFVSNDPALKKALHKKDWTSFAKIYNGSAYAVNKYDEKMKTNYIKYSG